MNYLNHRRTSLDPCFISAISDQTPPAEESLEDTKLKTPRQTVSRRDILPYQDMPRSSLNVVGPLFHLSHTSLSFQHQPRVYHILRKILHAQHPILSPLQPTLTSPMPAGAPLASSHNIKPNRARTRLSSSSGHIDCRRTSWTLSRAEPLPKPVQLERGLGCQAGIVPRWEIRFLGLDGWGRGRGGGSPKARVNGVGIFQAW